MQEVKKMEEKDIGYISVYQLNRDGCPYCGRKDLGRCPSVSGHGQLTIWCCKSITTYSSKAWYDEYKKQEEDPNYIIRDPAPYYTKILKRRLESKFYFFESDRRLNKKYDKPFNDITEIHKICNLVIKADSNFYTIINKLDKYCNFNHFKKNTSNYILECAMKTGHHLYCEVFYVIRKYLYLYCIGKEINTEYKLGHNHDDSLYNALAINDINTNKKFIHKVWKEMIFLLFKYEKIRMSKLNEKQ